MLVIGYVRVSSIEQESGHGPDVQRAAVRAYCLANNLGEPEIVEESASAESLSGRKEMLSILARARSAQESGEQAHVVFRSSDRLARDLMDQEGAVGDAFARGYRLHSTLSHEADLFHPAYAGDPMRVAIRQFFGIFNQLDKAIIQQRLDGGLYMKASKGGSTGGRYPFGYRGVNGDIVIDDVEAPAVRRAFAAHATGLDLGSIASMCAREFSELCGHWTKSAVKRLLDRSALYVRGMYRSRLGVEEIYHPELRIVEQKDLAEPHTTAPNDDPLDWDCIEDPVPLYSLALLLGAPIPWCQHTATGLGIHVVWRKQRMLIPHTGAKEIERAFREKADKS